MYRFETPWALLALLAPLALWLWRRFRRPPRPALPVAGLALFQKLPVTWRIRLRWLPAACAVTGWSLLTIALARPQYGQEQVRNISHGIAMEMIVDRSGSMRMPMNYRGRNLNRLETVKEVFREFVFGDAKSGMSGRTQDLLGVIAFAHYPYTDCPLTLDHNALSFALKNVQLITEDTDENGTAIGDAVAMGVARLVSAERTLASQTQSDASSYHIKSKVIILLTDGQDEGPHTRSISEAAQLAKAHGIKVYSIAIVADEDSPMGLSPLGPLAMMTQSYDTTDIEAMAKTTGGVFYTCSNANALKGIYREIDQLEKSEVEALRYVSHRELYLPYAAAGAAALLLALILAQTLFRRLP